jgi:hypothetical protein
MIYRTIILAVILYGCETWSLTLCEERRLRVFENRVLRVIFGAKRDELTGIGENFIMKSFMVCTLTQYFSSDKIENNEIGGACSTDGERERRVQGFCWKT